MNKPNKHIYIIGICGTFMGGVARLAKDLGYRVSGSDTNTYPPMSTQLEKLGVQLYEGYNAQHINDNIDMVVVGNAISRGNPELEQVLEKGIAYTSGAQWLSENVLQGRWVLAVSGTHGKTTTASLLAWLLKDNQLDPGFLIGGVVENFGESARLGSTPFFVIEADEYDTAFCDKRSKFVHYKPRTLVINNLEFDHADIFADLAAIQTQFHHLLRIVPQSGLVIYNQQDSIAQVLKQGCWSETTSFAGDNSDWQCEKISADASQFKLRHQQTGYIIESPLMGDHNMHNTVAAIAAAQHVGIPIENSIQSLGSFKSVKRRMEVIFENPQVRVYDDFAHHPTAIQQTLEGLRNRVADEPIIAVLEPRSNTMKQGVHKDSLGASLQSANISLIYADNTVLWDIKQLNSEQIKTYSSTDTLLSAIIEQVQQLHDFCHILIMSNGGFEHLHQRLIEQLKKR